ncbi:sugar ABC transporter ATP-binding protein [Aeromicrobium camelliae]|uniref:Sugar ABC transporter ATP-binding protein n=1 Tax=Aeromicrobium camelliae TaxID=1538144 RepID=A0A3N6ZDW4_9ACTN|nr:ATP-binding cassette domain-containing protein [Aeromicrobium camelliae]RQN08371.1 sugar ABC transporter ATP-binding protein [Aeromicrobium camelliae]
MTETAANDVTTPARDHGRQEPPVLEVRGAVKRFGAVTALGGVDLTLRRRQVVGLLGDNGAGKSTLIKAITGVHALDEGQILLDGEPVSIRTPTEARQHGIEAVYQDLALFDNLGIVSNLYLGNELTKPRRFRALGWLDRKAMERDARERLEKLQVNVPSFNSQIGLMSGGQRQAVAVARAVAFASRVLILDEPTAALGVRETRNVLDTISRLPEEHDLSVILISHNMDHVVQVCDEAVVMRQGRVVGSATPSPDTLQDIVSMIVGATGPGSTPPTGK